jgi:hypothetical protein
MNITENLTTQDHDRIMHLLAAEPVSVNEYFADPESQRWDNPDTLQTALYPKGGGYQLWSQDSRGGLECHGVYPSKDQALAAEKELVTEALNQANAWLMAQMDAEWAARPVCQISWSYPLRFKDNTDYPGGLELSSWADVLDFFHRVRFHVFEKEDPGSIYSWELKDARGRNCCPVRSHRGDIRLEEPEP